MLQLDGADIPFLDSKAEHWNAGYEPALGICIKAANQGYVFAGL